MSAARWKGPARPGRTKPFAREQPKAVEAQIKKELYWPKGKDRPGPRL
jgi:hypothetical protein